MPVEDDDDGGLFLAARAPGQVAAQRTSGASVNRGARSGNANFDPSSGRFAKKENKAPAKDAVVNPVVVNQGGLPQGVTQDEWDRRKDTVKDAARKIEAIDEAKAQSFLKDRVNDLSKVDVTQFVADAKQQQLDDLADILADQLGNKTQIFIKASRGVTQKAMAGLDDSQVVALLRRLEGRGFSKADINKKIVKKFKADRRTTIEQIYGDNTTAAKLAIELGGEDSAQFVVNTDDTEATVIELTTLFADAIEKMPAPIVNVTVEQPKPMRKIITRDKNNLIVSVDEVPE